MRVPAESDARPGRQGRSVAKGRLPWGYLIAAFIRFYGQGAWQCETYPTRDRVIPFKMFMLLSGTIRNLQAAEQLANTHAVAHAAALTMGSGKDLKLKRLTSQQIKTAYPEIVDGTA